MNDEDLRFPNLEIELERLRRETDRLFAEFEPPELPEIEMGYLLESE